jgi:CRISPR type I-E-associated protein CasB/Cse2
VDGDPVPSPRSRAERGFGASLARIRRREDTNDDDEGVTRRFGALLNCGSDALPTHLRHLLQLLDSRADHAPVNYRQLFFDLRDWDSPDRRVQRAWAAGFWRRGTPSAAAPTNDDEGDGDAATKDQEN